MEFKLIDRPLTDKYIELSNQATGQSLLNFTS